MEEERTNLGLVGGSLGVAMVMAMGVEEEEEGGGSSSLLLCVGVRNSGSVTGDWGVTEMTRGLVFLWWLNFIPMTTTMMMR